MHPQEEGPSGPVAACAAEPASAAPRRVVASARALDVGRAPRVVAARQMVVVGRRSRDRSRSAGRAGSPRRTRPCGTRPAGSASAAVFTAGGSANPPLSRNAVPERSEPGEDRGVRGTGQRRVGDRGGEADAPGARAPSSVGVTAPRIAVAADMVRAQGVDRHEQDVRPAGRGRCRRRRTVAARDHHGTPRESRQRGRSRRHRGGTGRSVRERGGPLNTSRRRKKRLTAAKERYRKPQRAVVCLRLPALGPVVPRGDRTLVAEARCCEHGLRWSCSWRCLAMAGPALRPVLPRHDPRHRHRSAGRGVAEARQS